MRVKMQIRPAGVEQAPKTSGNRTVFELVGPLVAEMSVDSIAEVLSKTLSKADVERLVQRLRNSECQGAK